MPAAAVIPAPIAYINVVAVKKLVVGFLTGATGPSIRVRVTCVVSSHPYREQMLALSCCVWDLYRLL